VRPAPLLVLLSTGLGVLVAFALPWIRSDGISGPAYDSAPVVPAVVAVVGAFGSGPLAAAALVFTGGAVSSLSPGGFLAYGAWVALGLAVPFALIGMSGVARRRHREVEGRLLSAVAGLFVATLFLHWQGPFTGWTLLGTAAAMLALGLAVATVTSLWVSELELAAGFAVMVATAGFELVRSSAPGYGMRVGAELGLAFAGVLAGLVLIRCRGLRPPRDRVALRAAGGLAALVYIAVVIVPLWSGRLEGWTGAMRFIPNSWLGIAGVLLAIRLAGAWLRQPIEAQAVFWIPVSMVVLIALDLIRERTYRLNWGGWIVVGVSLFLVLLGWLEQRGGLERFRVPEVLRVDRL
jgi:hypothetical protein